MKTKKNKIILSFILTIFIPLSLISNIKANEELNIEKEFLYSDNNYETYAEYDSDILNIVTYLDGVEVSRSYVKEDGNVYTKIDGVENLSIKIESSAPSALNNYAQNILFKAPPQFILTGSSTVLSLVINGNLRDAGFAVFSSAIMAWLMDGLTPHAAIHGSIQGLIGYLWANSSLVQINVTRKTYVYNGCHWLTYHEFKFPSGHVVGSYGWLDNPSLGIAPYVCKLASQQFPY